MGLFSELSTDYADSTAGGTEDKTFTISKQNACCLYRFEHLFGVNQSHIVDRLLTKFFDESDICDQIDGIKTTCDSNLDEYKKET